MRRETGSRVIRLGMVAACVWGVALRASAVDLDLGTAQHEAVAVLQRAIQIDTSNPPGDTTELAAYFADLLQAAGVETTLYESEPGQAHVVARLRGDGTARPLLLLNHMDVVAAEAAEWDYPPFEGRIVDGKLYGRGAIDMKGLAVLQLQVMRLLAAQQVPLKRDVIFYAAPDEEAGGARGAQWMTERHWAEVDAEYVLSEGGSGRQDTFGPGSRVYFVQTAEKGVCWLTMTARGTSRHGSRPIPDNPNLYLLRALDRIVAYDTPVTLTPTVEKALRELGPVVGGATGRLWARAGNPLVLPLARPSLLADDLFNPLVRTTINVTNLQSGYKINVVPSVATASLDCRILPGETPEQLLQLLERLTHDPAAAEWEAERETELGRPLTPEERRQVSFEWVVRGEATESSVQSAMYGLIERVLNGVDPEAPVVPLMSAGGTDLRFWRERCAQAYGFAPYLLTDEQEGAMHGKNEYLRVDDYRRSLEIYYDLVRRAATGEA